MCARADWPGLDNAILPRPYQTLILLDSKSGSSCHNNNNNNNIRVALITLELLYKPTWTLVYILVLLYFSATKLVERVKELYHQLLLFIWHDLMTMASEWANYPRRTTFPSHSTNFMQLWATMFTADLIQIVLHDTCWSFLNPPGWSLSSSCLQLKLQEMIWKTLLQLTPAVNTALSRSLSPLLWSVSKF